MTLCKVIVRPQHYLFSILLSYFLFIFFNLTIFWGFYSLICKCLPSVIQLSGLMNKLSTAQNIRPCISNGGNSAPVARPAV